MKCRINIIFLIFTIISAFSSCMEDDAAVVGAGDQTTVITIGTRGILNQGIPDDRISSLRIMSFSTTGMLLGNKFYAPDELSNAIKYSINVGTYNFVFIANEPTDEATQIQLEYARDYTDLREIGLPASAFDDDIDIPMVSVHKNVSVRVDGRVTLPGGETHSVWDVLLTRVGIKLQISLSAPQNLTNIFEGIMIANLPDYVPMLPDDAAYAGIRNTTRTFSASDFSVSYDGTWRADLARVILPSNVFAPSTDAAKAITMSTRVDGSYSTPNTLGGNEAANDYTSPRNQHYIVTGTVSLNSAEINVRAENWDPVSTDNVLENRILNLTSMDITVDPLHSSRVYFYSNQKDVFIEPIGYYDDGTAFNVEDMFQGISGSDTSNFVFDPATGEGYMDINAASDDVISGSIFLNAGGLVRSLRGRIVASDIKPSDWETSPYVGTFHRWNETGERIIFGGNANRWTAEVTEWDGKDQGLPCWVVLSNRRSLDPKVGTLKPGNAENFQVTNGVTKIDSYSHGGLLYFRVGLTGKLESVDSEPRYARITVNREAQGGAIMTSYIYVRQGEKEDYLFSTSEKISGNSVYGGMSRVLAKKICVYNLTVPNSMIGLAKVEVGTRGGKWTEFPTQSGYLFQWYGTKGYIPGGNLPSGVWEADDNSKAQIFQSSWESCPAGYRRFKNSQMDLDLNTRIDRSEIGQSLFYKNPKEPGGPNSLGYDYALSIPYTENNLWGFYADGYFDRLERPDDYTVNIGPTMACRGRIIYNPDNHKSVFFPSTGRREWATGTFLLAGISGVYWTATALPSDDSTYRAAYLFLVNAPEPEMTTPGIYVPIAMTGRNGASAIRCVAEN